MVNVKVFSPEVMEGFSEFTPYVNPEEFISFAIRLLLLGFVCVIAFVSYEVVHSTTKSRSVVKEFTLATAASILLGSGTLFAMLGAGLYI